MIFEKENVFASLVYPGELVDLRNLKVNEIFYKNKTIIDKKKFYGAKNARFHLGVEKYVP